MGKSNLKKANSVEIKSKLTLYLAIKAVFFLFTTIIIVAILNKIKLLKIEKNAYIYIKMSHNIISLI